MQAEQTFTEGSASVGAARRFVADVLVSWDLEAAVWDAQLLVSELATNAVLHAGSQFSVSVSLQDHVVRLEVRDGVSRAPRARHHGLDATTGRGLDLIASMSRAWGVSQRTGGKSVWCELPSSLDPDGGTPDRSDRSAAPDLDAFRGARDAADLGDSGRVSARAA